MWCLTEVKLLSQTITWSCTFHKNDWQTHGLYAILTCAKFQRRKKSMDLSIDFLNYLCKGQ